MAVIISDSNNAKYGTGVGAIVLNSGGSGYSATDVLTLNAGDTNSTLVVDSVDGSGAVVTFHRTATGSGYSTTTGVGVTGGGGSLATFDITVQAGLGTTNGWYRVEASNFNLYGTRNTTYALTSERTIAVTFANAGNCQGLYLCLWNSTTSSPIDRDVVVKLQEFVGSVWTDRASVTMTDDEICGTKIANSHRRAAYFKAFKFASPYAVDTTASKWRFSVIQSGGTYGTWNLMTYNGTNPFYATWCDTQISANDNDVFIIDAPIVIDKSITMDGPAAATGGFTSAAMCCCISSNTANPEPENIALLTWELDPPQSFTLTYKGVITLGNDSAIRIGTEIKPIPYAQQAIVSHPTPTVTGYAYNITTPFDGPTRYCQRSSFFAYGEIPADKYAILASDAAIGQKNIVTTVDMSSKWSIGDHLYIGKRDGINGGATTEHTIGSISGTTITLTANLATGKANAGGQVLRKEGYGVKFIGTSNYSIYLALSAPASFCLSGVLLDLYTYFVTNGVTDGVDYASAENTYSSKNIVNDCFHSGNTSNGIHQLFVPRLGFEMKRNMMGFGTFVSNSGNGVYAFQRPLYISGTLDISDNRIVGLGRDYGLSFISTSSLIKVLFKNNTIENSYSSNYYAIQVYGVNSEYTGNTFWNVGSTSNGGSLMITRCINTVLGNNTFNGNTLGYSFYDGGFCIGTYSENDVFNSVADNTADIYYGAGGYFDFEFKNANEIKTITSTYQTLMNENSKVRYTTYNSTTNDDKITDSYGDFQRCGDGLTDTTVHTSGTGKFSLRFEPKTSTNLLKWTQTIPTGNIQNKTAGFAVWVKINAEAYWAGTKRMPRLNINYDDGTVVYAEAAQTTDWQLLFVPVTPTTTFGQITVYVDGYTDATTTDAYFYVDDMSVFYPPGVQLDLGGMDLWANALPITPCIATNLTAADVWNVQTDTLTTAGSVGKLAVETEKKVDDNQALIISL
jgi:hypothetical protein